MARVAPFMAKGGPLLMAKGGILLMAEIGILYLTIYSTNFFRYTRISPVQGTAHWVASLWNTGGQAGTP